MESKNTYYDEIELLIAAFKLYNISKLNANVYKSPEGIKSAKSLVGLYYKLVKPNYNDIIFNFERKYITNEALVEKNNTPEEMQGIKLIYKYIQEYDIENDDFNILANSLMIHGLLYKPLDDKNQSNETKKLEELLELEKKAKEEKNLGLYKQLRQQIKSLTNDTPTRFGGNLRKNTAIMQDYKAGIPSAEEAMKLFNEYSRPYKIKEYEELLMGDDIHAYIEYCVKTCADLIAIQPFPDGNKRTFRSLLNLMFKKKNLPPVYIVKKERKQYHIALEKAICDKDYDDLITFYYFKLCDSIYEIPYLENYMVNSDENKTK